MTSLTLELPNDLAPAEDDPERLTRKLRLAAAVRWYELRRVGRRRAAEIAGLSRSEFLTELARLGVPPFQHDVDDVPAESRTLEEQDRLGYERLPDTVEDLALWSQAAAWPDE